MHPVFYYSSTDHILVFQGFYIQHPHKNTSKTRQKFRTLCGVLKWSDWSNRSFERSACEHQSYPCHRYCSFDSQQLSPNLTQAHSVNCCCCLCDLLCSMTWARLGFPIIKLNFRVIGVNILCLCNPLKNPHLKNPHTRWSWGFVLMDSINEISFVWHRIKIQVDNSGAIICLFGNASPLVHYGLLNH